MFHAMVFYHSILGPWVILPFSNGNPYIFWPPRLRNPGFNPSLQYQTPVAQHPPWFRLGVLEMGEGIRKEKPTFGAANNNPSGLLMLLVTL